MRRPHVIADIRKHRGNSPSIIGLVGQFASNEGADIDWLVRQDQLHLSPPGQILLCADEYDPNGSGRLRERLTQLAQNGSGGPFWVFSYDAFVRTDAQNLGLANLTAKSPAELISKASLQRRSYWASSSSSPPPSAIGSTGALTGPEAIELAKRVLRMGGHYTPQTALKQSSLRLRMAQLDRRAMKMPGDGASAALIPSIVESGFRQGWLKGFRTADRTGTESIYLVEPNLESNLSSAHEPALAAPLTAATREPGATVQTGRDGVSSVQTFGAAMVPLAPSPSESNHKKHPNRACEFERELARSRIGAMPETRELVMDAVEETLKSYGDEKPTLAALFAGAGRLAEERARTINYKSEKNWPIAVRCVQRLMLWAGVIEGEQGKPVRDQIGAASSRVYALKNDFRRRCAAHMVEHIIASLGGISFDDDLYYLGLTLYRRGAEKAVPPDDLKTQADELLTFMEAAGTIEMGDDRIIRKKTASLSPVT